MTTHYIPAGHHTIVPYLLVKGVGKLLDFLSQAFGAEVLDRMEQPDGLVRHAQVRLGDSRLMMGEACEEYPPMPASLYFYVPDTDAAFHRALLAGATTIMPPADQFYGDRNAGVKDCAGNIWWLATHLEDLSAEELRKRAAARHQGSSSH